ncbi:MAG: histidinol dehydrogenase [Candidatus Alkanophagales archaeon]
MTFVGVRVLSIRELDATELSSKRRSEILQAIPDVRRIVEDVKREGDAAVLRYTERFDGVRLERLEVSGEEMEEARERVGDAVLKSLESAAKRIKRFHCRQRRASWLEEFTSGEGIFLGELFVPLSVVGAYVPAGYPSTALMTVIPAKVAGVEDVVVCTPPRRDGRADPLSVAAAELAGASKIYKVGGAQAIAALAFGTESIPKVEKIVGPGGVFVTAAKLLVRGEGVEIDFPAGPSEVLIIADESADAAHVAADMLAQAEHGRDSLSLLLTPSEALAKRVEEIVRTEVERAEPAHGGSGFGDLLILVAENLDECVKFANEYAAEHVEILTENPLEVLLKIKSAGAVFVGGHSPVAAGDYAAGTNHVLPTAGYARVFSGLGVEHFMKRISVQMLTEEGLARIKDDVVRIANAERMRWHARSVELRFERTA